MLDFRMLGDSTLSHFPRLLFDWIPGGRLIGSEYVARNPRRADRSPGSFSINVKTGRWCDFATGDKGGDPVSLYAYLFNISQLQAAREVAEFLGVDHG